MDLAKSIKSLREEAGFTQEQLAKKVGVSRATVTQWETGWSQPRMGAVQKIADVFGISVAKLVADDPTNHEDGYVNVPLLGSIAAGEPIDMDAVEDTFPIPAEMHDRYPHAFMLHVDGGSMNRRIPDGCLVMVDPDDRVPDGRSAYAVCVNGYSATIKRVRKLANGYELVPDSYDPTQRPIVFDYGVEGTQEVTVIGRVVWMTAPFDYEI